MLTRTCGAPTRARDEQRGAELPRSRPRGPGCCRRASCRARPGGGLPMAPGQAELAASLRQVGVLLDELEPWCRARLPR
jgi:hypothetical protein